MSERFDPFQEFCDVVSRSNVEVAKPLSEAIKTGELRRDRPESRYLPHVTLHQLYFTVGALVTKGTVNGAPLISDQIEVDPDRSDFVLDTLVKLLNDQRDAVDNPPEATDFEQWERSLYGGCAEAEVRFCDELGIVEPTSDSKEWWGGNPVVLLRSGEVVGYKKAFGEETVITFSDLTIGGLSFPAGSMLAIDRIDEGRTLGVKRNRGYFNLDKMKINARFLRLTPFALPPELRRDYFKTSLSMKSGVEQWYGHG